MQKKQLLLPLLIVMLLGGMSTVQAQASGNVDELCKSISDDLSVANGCIDDNDLEDTITSSGGLFVLEAGDKSGLLMLFVAVGFIVAVITGAVIKSKLAARR